jgi:hypothetical protein
MSYDEETSFLVWARKDHLFHIAVANRNAMLAAEDYGLEAAIEFVVEAENYIGLLKQFDKEHPEIKELTLDF